MCLSMESSSRDLALEVWEREHWLPARTQDKLQREVCLDRCSLEFIKPCLCLPCPHSMSSLFLFPVTHGPGDIHKPRKHLCSVDHEIVMVSS